MSRRTAAQFLEKLVYDETLREQVRQAEKGRTEKAPVLVEMGAAAGFEFTEADLHDILCALHQHKIGALSEAEVVQVAGSLVDLPDWHSDHE